MSFINCIAFLNSYKEITESKFFLYLHRPINSLRCWNKSSLNVSPDFYGLVCIVVIIAGTEGTDADIKHHYREVLISMDNPWCRVSKVTRPGRTRRHINLRSGVS